MDTFKTKKTRSFIAKLGIFFLVLYLLDFSIGSFLRKIYFQQDSGYLFRTTYSLDSTKAELLIFGSSTANHHYDPSLFENRLQMSAYNTGRDGGSFFYVYSILHAVLKRYSPKIVILDFNVGELLKDQGSTDRISFLLPYFKNHPEIRSVILLKSPYEKYKLQSKIYPFNSLMFTSAIRNANLNENSKRDHGSESGYIPIERVSDKPITYVDDPVIHELDSNKISLFKDFVRECTTAGVKLYVVVSPSLVDYKYEDPSINLAKEVTHNFDVSFYNFSKLFRNSHNLFADNLHLNDSGAHVFSNKLIDTILKTIAIRSPVLNTATPR